jgi:hypothetical protein
MKKIRLEKKKNNSKSQIAKPLFSKMKTKSHHHQTLLIERILVTPKSLFFYH